MADEELPPPTRLQRVMAWLRIDWRPKLALGFLLGFVVTTTAGVAIQAGTGTALVVAGIGLLTVALLLGGEE